MHVLRYDFETLIDAHFSPCIFAFSFPHLSSLRVVTDWRGRERKAEAT